MRKLSNTLYITNPDRYLSLDGETVVVLQDNQKIARVPLHNLEEIITFGYTGASPALMGACAEKNISLCFLNNNGKFLARITGKVYGNVLLRKEQYRISNNLDISNKIAKNMVFAKVYNSKWIIERAIRDYPYLLDIKNLKKKSEFLSKSLTEIRNCENLDTLRGIEGQASSMYFSIFDELILQQKEDFYFKTRNRRPPTDNVNAMLSLAYTLLASMCASALETVGLDPYVGFLHRDRPGRISLALDLMEEFRGVLADRFVITLINKKNIKANDFITKENGAVIFKEEGLKKFLTAWQNKKQEIITHPFLKEKIEWGLLPYVQAMLLARYLRKDLDEYPSFMWK
ncbi:MAG: type I-C CRISPR-associated endonuclease Cas1c [Bacilli bacterium]|nr:type I-C CRISPR-associated endonuclease Cas1c [Bacilli bacterium]MDD4795430.1 type I-C CRISPR-associated endonuclease Cas1c [Bacilli bacterium]